MSRPGRRELILIRKLIKSPSVKSFWLDARGSSMRPAIRSGTAVRFRKLSGGENLKPGDVVLLKLKNKFLVHRIILIKNSSKGKIYLIKGDFRLAADGWFPTARILAVAAMPIPNQRLAKITIIYSLCLLWLGKLARFTQYLINLRVNKLISFIRYGCLPKTSHSQTTARNLPVREMG